MSFLIFVISRPEKYVKRLLYWKDICFYHREPAENRVEGDFYLTRAPPRLFVWMHKRDRDRKTTFYYCALPLQIFGPSTVPTPHGIIKAKNPVVKCSSFTTIFPFFKYTYVSVCYVLKRRTLFCTDSLHMTCFAKLTLHCKVHTFWEGHKILQNLHRRFVLCSAS